MRYYIVVGLFVAADQISKLLVRLFMAEGESVCLIGDFFRLTHVQNSGAAFSMFSGHRLVLILVPLLIIAAAVVWVSRVRDAHWSFYMAWTMIIAGGIGNLIDRIAFGQVTDMLDFSIFPPVFNLADIGVTLGCCLLVVYVLFGERLKK